MELWLSDAKKHRCITHTMKLYVYHIPMNDRKTKMQAVTNWRKTTMCGGKTIGERTGESSARNKGNYVKNVRITSTFKFNTARTRVAFVRERAEKVISWAYHMHHLRHTAVQSNYFSGSSILRLKRLIFRLMMMMLCHVCARARAQIKQLNCLNIYRRASSQASSVHIFLLSTELCRRFPTLHPKIHIAPRLLWFCQRKCYHALSDVQPPHAERS